MSLPAIVENFAPHWKILSNADYHADKTAVSSTALRRVLKSPNSFLVGQRGQSMKETPAMAFGSAVHAAILEPELFKSHYVIAPKFSGTGSVKAKADWRLELPKDAVIMDEDDYNAVLEIVNSVMKRRDVCGILKSGKAELSGYYADPETGILCRIRPDWLNMRAGVMLDVKTTQDIQLEEFSKSIWNYRYDFQFGFYKEGIELITGRDVDSFFLAIQKTPPYECALYLADELLIERGKSDYHLALNKLKSCLDSGVFEGYQQGIQEIGLPAWA
jgi:hypothetical protein